jgi:hypothetical protein
MVGSRGPQLRYSIVNIDLNTGQTTVMAAMTVYVIAVEAVIAVVAITNVIGMNAIKTIQTYPISYANSASRSC